MCGFAGWVSTQGPADPVTRASILRRMGNRLARRGPDDEARYDDGSLALVFRRLAVLDLDTGQQPHFDERRTLLSVVNGEIYNHAELRAGLTGHTFAGRSDCEVVVHGFERHGAQYLDQLEGMYALLVWDRQGRRGLLARDRLGIKPLYYAPIPGGLVFGSELTALLAHPACPREPDPADLDLSYLGTEDYTAPNFDRVPSFVRGVSLLPGGHSLPLAPGNVGQPRRYWSLRPAIERSRVEPVRPPQEYVAGYADLLADSIERHVVADVPVGAFLSGGLDSSAIVAAAAAGGARLQCFSVSEATTVATGDVGRAARLASSLGLPFHPVRYHRESFADEIDFTLESLEEVVCALDAPRFAPEQFFKFELHRYAKTASPELKVVQLGQGADEFAGGYSRPYLSRRGSWSDYEADSLLPRARARAGEDLAPFHAEMLSRLVVLQSHNLWNEDRVAAAHGIEARVPFLDHRLVEFLAAVPAQLHRELFWDKAIVRQAAARWLGAEFAGAPKVLFWQAADRSSVHAIMAACARRAYPQFRDSYSGDAELDRLYLLAAGTGAGARDATQRLLAAMTVAVFARLCEAPAHGDDIPPERRASGLTLDSQWTGGEVLR